MFTQHLLTLKMFQTEEGTEERNCYSIYPKGVKYLVDIVKTTLSYEICSSFSVFQDYGITLKLTMLSCPYHWKLKKIIDDIVAHLTGR